MPDLARWAFHLATLRTAPLACVRSMKKAWVASTASDFDGALDIIQVESPKLTIVYLVP